MFVYLIYYQITISAVVKLYLSILIKFLINKMNIILTMYIIIIINNNNIRIIIISTTIYLTCYLEKVSFKKILNKTELKFSELTKIKRIMI